MRWFSSNIRSYGVLFWVCFALLTSCKGPPPGDNDPLQQFTGSHTRVVWVQEQEGGADTFAFGDHFRLMGYDSHDGKQERPLLQETANFFKPLITPDGQKVVVSSRSSQEIYLVDFEGGKKEVLGPGVAVEVWLDPATGTTWVYALAGEGTENKYFSTRPLVRFPLSSPGKRELVWKKTPLSWSNFDISRDGKYAAGLFPWPHAGILSLKENTWKSYGKGCWTALSPDSSAILWVFDGLHRNLNFVNPVTGESWSTTINSASGIAGFEIYHPRWSNHVRYLTVTGPYLEGEGGNKITGGGRRVEVYVGRFSPDLKTVEDWFQVTHNGLADFYPDVWLANGAQSVLVRPQAQGAGLFEEERFGDWPGEQGQLLFLWKDLLGDNKLESGSLLGFSQFRVRPRKRARFNRFLEMDLKRSGLVASLPGAKVAEVLRQKAALGIEFLFSPSGTGPAEKGPVLRLQDAGERDVLVIAQQGSGIQVVVDSGGSQVERLTIPESLQARRPEHFFLSLEEGQVQLYGNGRLLATLPLAVPPLERLQDVALIFGNPDGLGGAINGALSHVALYAGISTESEIGQRARMVLGGLEVRQMPPLLRIEAELVEASKIPSPQSLGAYRRALVVNRYRINEVLAGSSSEQEILVAQWAVLDGVVLSETGFFSPGMEATLLVERFDDHPELEGERLLMDMFDPDLDLYYQVAPCPSP